MAVTWCGYLCSCGCGQQCGCSCGVRFEVPHNLSGANREAELASALGEHIDAAGTRPLASQHPAPGVVRCEEERDGKRCRFALGHRCPHSFERSTWWRQRPGARRVEKGRAA